MISRNFLAGTAAAAIITMFGGAAALADPIDLGGYSGPVTIKYSDSEGFTGGLVTLSNGVSAPASGSENFGIFTITSISGFETPPNILNQSQFIYAGVFTGITTTTVTPEGPPGPLGWISSTTGGTFALYQIPVADYNAAQIQSEGTSGCDTTACADLFFNGITNVGGTEILTWNLGDSTPSYTATGFTPGSIVNSGQNNAPGTITGGADMGQFLPNISVQNDFCINNGTGVGTVCLNPAGGPISNAADPANNWLVLSNDPVTGHVIPEPASLLLFGSGILGLGLLRRRRRRA